MADALTLSDVASGYGQHLVLRDVSLAIRKERSPR